MVHCESPYKERFKQRSGLREKDPWHFKGWQEVSLAEEAARDRMVGDEAKKAWGKEGWGGAKNRPGRPDYAYVPYWKLVTLKHTLGDTQE